MEKKYLRFIGITAAVLTGLMLVYTIFAALSSGDSVGSANQQNSGKPAVQTGQVDSPTQPVATQVQPESGKLDEKLFPKELVGMQRADVVTGQEAIDSVSQMHGTNIKVVKAYVVSYQGKDKQQIMIWVSDSKDTQDAQALFTAMDAKMPKTKYFQNYKTVTVDGKEYKSVTSQDGMQHYYWLKGTRNIWVGIMAEKPADILKQVAPLY